MSEDPDNFRVIATDDYGEPVRCSFCTRTVKHVVALPITDHLDLEQWLGLCAYCVLAMAKALARAEGKLP